MRELRFLVLLFGFFSLVCMSAFGDEPAWKVPAGAGKETVVLLLSDIHFDPFADGAAKELDKIPVAAWQAVFDKQIPGKYPQYKTDTNYRLLVSALDKIKGLSPHIDSAILCGDFICHDFEAKYLLSGSLGSCPEFASKTIEFISLMVKEALPGKPVYFVMGNNDSDNGDYNIVPDGAMLDGLAGYFDTVKEDPAAASDFRRGGYYEEPFHGLVNNELIVLNDVFWHKRFKRGNKVKYDPGMEEMKWLRGKLDAAARDGKKAVIAMHIPPGIDQYLGAKDKKCSLDDGFLLPEYNNIFLELMKSHREVVRNIFSGHTHFDDFRVFSFSGKPLLLTCIIPSVSPVHGNNPAFELAKIEAEGNIKDKAVYILSGLSGKDPETAAWIPEYTFDNVYGLDGYSPDNLYKLAENIRTSPDMLHRYLLYYTAGNVFLSLVLERQKNISAYECALTNADFREYSACACGQ